MSFPKIILQLFCLTQPQPKVVLSAEKVKHAVKYSLKKYDKAYKLLEKYDKTHPKNSSALADPGVVQKYF